MPQIDSITLFSQVYHSTMFFFSFLFVLFFYLLPQYIIHFSFVKLLWGFLNIYLKYIKLMLALILGQRLILETKVNKILFLFTGIKKKNSVLNIFKIKFPFKLSNLTLIEYKNNALSQVKKINSFINKQKLYFYFTSKWCLFLFNKIKINFNFYLKIIICKKYIKKNNNIKKYISLLLKAS